jgi:PAS domain S-box-containing protein
MADSAITDSATTKELARSGASFTRRYGLAFTSVAGTLLLDLLFRHFNLPHPFSAFALSAIAITFWYGGTKPGIVAVLLSSLIRGFIFEGETSSLSRVLYELVFLTFAVLMIWVRRRKEALEVAIVDRTAELTAANEDLRRRKEQLDGLFELSPDAVILTDEDFHVLRVNKEFTRIFGYSAEEVAGQWLPELIVPEELRAEALKNRDALISGNRVELEAIRQRKDGVRFDVSVVGRGISLGFEQAGVYLIIYRDISERKKAEGKLRRSEGYLAEAQKLTHTGSWAWNVRTGVLFWSRQIFSIYDYEYQEMGPTWPQFLERVHPEDRPQIEQRARMEASGKEWLDSQSDFRIILPNGTMKHLHSVAHPVRDDSGEITEVVGTVMDVTEQWKARTELEKAFEEIKQRTEDAHRSERQLRDVVNTVPAHVWSTSPEGQVDFVNDRWLQFTGLALDEALGWKWEAVLHPDDRTRVVGDWHTAIKNGQAMECEARVRRADGEYCWWFIRNVPLRGETGKLVRWYGTAIDIDDRKQAEQALRKSEERWRSVFENSAIGVALTDLNGRFLATNHVYQTIVGYSEKELHALYFLDITHEDYREANWALITELLEGKRQQFQIEKKNICAKTAVRFG